MAGLEPLTADEWRAGLRELGLSQVGAAPVFGVSPRTAQTYALEGPSGPAALAMRLLLSLPKRAREKWLSS